MNMLKHYIVEIHSVTPCLVEDHSKEFEVVKVDLTYNCYGVVERQTRQFSPNKWKEAQNNGWFMA